MQHTQSQKAAKQDKWVKQVDSKAALSLSHCAEQSFGSESHFYTLQIPLCFFNKPLFGNKQLNCSVLSKRSVALSLLLNANRHQKKSSINCAAHINA